MIPTIVPPRLAGHTTPADAAEIAIRAHQLVRTTPRRTPHGPVVEARCSCGTTLVRPADDTDHDALDAYVEHGLDAAACITAQLVDPHWWERLCTAAAAVVAAAARLDGLDRQLADQAALGTVTRHAPAPDGEDEPRYACGCLIVVTEAFGHRFGCGGAR